MRTYHINIDWQEEWSEQADEFVTRGSKLRKVTVQANNFLEALQIANKQLNADEKDDLNRYNAGVL
jgi:hypothetical protein